MQTNRTKSAGAVVLSARGQALVAYQNSDTWSLPKGHIDPGEDARAAAERDIYEESGLTDLTFVRDLAHTSAIETRRVGVAWT